MNFLNDSLKTLKNVLQEGLDQKVDFEGTSSVGEVTTRTLAGHEHDNLKKLCEHQSDEVISHCFLLLRCCRELHMTFIFLFRHQQQRRMCKLANSSETSATLCLHHDSFKIKIFPCRSSCCESKSSSISKRSLATFPALPNR